MERIGESYMDIPCPILAELAFEAMLNGIGRGKKEGSVKCGGCKATWNVQPGGAMNTTYEVELKEDWLECTKKDS